jgi:EpsI family protein
MGSIVTFIGCSILIAGKLSSTFLLQYISLPVTITGIVILTGGFSYIRVAWLPIVYLFFVFGLFDEILGSMNIYLQYAAAWTASSLLKLIGMPVVLKGLIIQLPHISLEVERGCSGQKHILALLALAVPIVYLRLRGWLPRILLIVIAFFIGVFGNGVRIAVIGLWSINHPNSIHGPYDVFYVSFIFFFGTILFLFGIWIAENFWPRKRHKNPSTNIDQPHPIGPPSMQPLLAAFALGTLILCATAFFVQLWRPDYVILQKPLGSLSKNVGAWSGQDVAGPDNPLTSANPDLLLYREYVNNSGNKIELNIAYFEAQNEKKRIVSYRTDWLYSHDVEILSLSDNNIGKTFRKNEKGEVQTVYFWFDIDGKTTAGRYTTKMKTIIGAITKQQTNGAIVVVSFPQAQAVSTIEQYLFIQQIFPLIQNLLKQTRVI